MPVASAAEAFALLHADSPRAVVPPAAAGAALRPHQLAAIRAMQRMEDSSFDVACGARRHAPVALTPDVAMAYQLGVLGDPHGYGKTRTALVHMALRPVLQVPGGHCTRTDVSTDLEYSNTVVTRTHTTEVVMHANVVVVHRNSLAQWEREAVHARALGCRVYVAPLRRNIPDADLVLMLSSEAEAASGDAAHPAPPHIAVVTDAHVKKIAEHLAILGGGRPRRFQRIVIDDAHEIHGHVIGKLNAGSCFTWLLTPRPEQVLPRSTCRPMYTVASGPVFLATSGGIQRIVNVRAVQWWGPWPDAPNDKFHRSLCAKILTKAPTRYDLVRMGFRVVASLEQLRTETASPSKRARLGAPDDDSVCPISLDSISAPAVFGCCCKTFDVGSVLRLALSNCSASSVVCPNCRGAHVDWSRVTVVVDAVAQAVDEDLPTFRPTKLDALATEVERIVDAAPGAKVLVYERNQHVFEHVVEALAQFGARALRNKSSLSVRKSVELFSTPGSACRALVIDDSSFNLDATAATNLIICNRVTDTLVVKKIIARANTIRRTTALVVSTMEMSYF